MSAARYFQHALWLVDQRGRVTDPYDTNAAMLISSIFLNLWKAASVIVGDPSKDKDYQKRHRALGLTDDFYNEKIMPLRRLRDDSDVAHYSLRNADLEKLKETIGAAIDVVREVIVAHSRAIQRPEGTPN